MNSKRWIAIVIVIALIVVSFGVRLTTQVASSVVNGVLDYDTSTYEAQIVEEGDWDEQIAIIDLQGAIMDDDTSPLLGQGYNYHRMLTTIDQAAHDDTEKAVLLKIDSPGGAVGETAEIYEALKEMQEEFDKPLFVAMEGMAASGGYYAAAPADKIYAQASTITGSIGVIMESINFAGLAEKYGISFNTIKSGKHKDIMSASREMTEEEKEILQSMIDEMYDDFVEVIVDGREMSDKEVRKLADGRIYTGKQAKEVGLVDEVGSLDDALVDLRESYDLENAQVIKYSKDAGFFTYFNVDAKSIFGAKDEEIDAVMSLLRQSDKPRAMYIY